MKTIKEISIKDYKPLSSSMINRHYYFIINISYEDNSDKRINKRYSEIEEFYKVLILKYPGCRIPQFPPKTFSISILIKEEDKNDLIVKMENFFKKIINHKILREKIIVNDFLSNHEINENNSLKTNKMKISEDILNDSGFNVNEDLDKSEKNEIENNIINEFEQLEFKNSSDYESWYENNKLNDLLNIFLEEENSKKEGIINKTKGIISSTYNYIISGYSQEIQNNNISESSITYPYCQEDNYDFIKKISDELGEENYLNEYERQIDKLNAGLPDLLINFVNLKNFNQTKLNSLNKIKDICKENINYKSTKEKEKDKDDFDINDDRTIKNKKTIDKKEKWDKKIFEGEINNKLAVYISINRDFYEKDYLDKINENKIAVEELKEIFDRKKSHINFLLKLNSKLKDIENKKTIEPNNKTLIKDYDLIKTYVDIEKEFINKLNKDLKYEIDNYRENIENSVYKNINELYTNKYNKQNEIFEKLNEEISLESDSENSSKEESIEKISSQPEKNIDKKKSERKGSLNSGDDF